MRKRVINEGDATASVANRQSLDVEHLARVEVSSEEESYPIESALAMSAGAGWRAGKPGQQTVRLFFDEPQSIRHMVLEFHENEHPRTQQFVLRWSSDGGRSYREIVRQQYNFSPPGTTSEFEDYDVGLEGVTTVELTIIPDIGGGSSPASLTRLRFT